MKVTPELDSVYMGMALGMSALSKAKRKQVGAILVTKNGVILTGVNGTPSGWDNTCETEVNHEREWTEWNATPVLVTREEVIHAELNCVLKAAKEGVSVIGATMYCTLSPCVQCAAMLSQAGVTRFVYKEKYRSLEGVNLLNKHGISAQEYKE